MTDIIYRDWSQEILTSCESSLLELKQRYDDAIFTALVAFLGIQNSMWPLWTKTCKDLGYAIEDTYKVLRLTDLEIHKLPWFCVVNPFTEDASWLLVRGSGLPDSALVFPELMRADVCATMFTLNQDEPPILYGQASEIFYRWGLYTDRQKLDVFGTVWGFSELPSEGRSELHIPIAYCEQLLGDWSLWYQSFLPLQDLFITFVRHCIALDSSSISSSSLRWHFLSMADALWMLLLDSRIIQYAPFDQGKSSFWDIFRTKKALTFHGFMALFGNHQQLWQEIKKMSFYE